MSQRFIVCATFFVTVLSPSGRSEVIEIKIHQQLWVGPEGSKTVHGTVPLTTDDVDWLLAERVIGRA